MIQCITKTQSHTILTNNSPKKKKFFLKKILQNAGQICIALPYKQHFGVLYGVCAITNDWFIMAYMIHDVD